LSYGHAWANLSNTPFSKYKKWVHEGGISTPLIMRWPKNFGTYEGWVREAVHVVDLMPTVLEAAGAEYPKVHKGKAILPLEGTSLLPMTKGNPRKSPEAYYWEHGGRAAVRRERWKLVKGGNEGWELYDMDTDRMETKNVAAAHPERVKELEEAYGKWAKRCNVEPWEKVQEAIKRKAAAKKAGAENAPGD
jgi:arylsulfatase A-like enzyme